MITRAINMSFNSIKTLYLQRSSWISPRVCCFFRHSRSLLVKLSTWCTLIEYSCYLCAHAWRWSVAFHVTEITLVNFGDLSSHNVFILSLSESQVSLWVRARRQTHKKWSVKSENKRCSKPDAKSSKHNASVCVTTDRNATDSSVTEVNKTHIADPFEHS